MKATITKRKAKDLKVGDVITGGVIISAPELIVTQLEEKMYGKNKIYIGIKYHNSGKEKIQVWGKNTLIGVENER